MYKKTILLQLFAEEVEEVVETVEEVDQPVETEETEESVQEPVSLADLEWKYKDDRGKLADVPPEEIITNFQLGRKYKEHESDIQLTKRLKEIYGVSDTEELNKLFDEAINSNIRESAPEGIPEDQLDDWVEFQKQKKLEEAKKPEKEREAKMMQQVEQLKQAGKIQKLDDIPDVVFDIYKKRGYADLEGAYDSYQLQQTKIKLKEKENAMSSPGSLKGNPVIPKQKPVSQMSKEEYEAYKEERRAIAQSNGG